MAYERDGISGSVRDYIDEDTIPVVDKRPEDQPYVRVTHFPWDTDPDDDALPEMKIIPLGKQHEVTYWDPTDEMTIGGRDDPVSPVIETHYRVTGAERACELAVEVAREKDVVIWDSIIRLRPRVVVSSLGVTTESSNRSPEQTTTAVQEVYQTIEDDPRIALRETDDGEWVAINRETDDWVTEQTRDAALENIQNM